LSASDATVSQEVADGKISVQSACALNTRYMVASVRSGMLSGSLVTTARGVLSLRVQEITSRYGGHL
jgi:hypothetical protein